MQKTTGIHHITAMVNDAQRNIDFYAGVLGLRLVKKTINFDRPEVYHLYFGNEAGDPGTVITFFPWENQMKGRIGTGQVGVTSYVIPAGSLSFWKDRLKRFGVRFIQNVRYGETYLQFQDPDGLEIELVERNEGAINPWSYGGVTSDVAIKGFGGATLISAQPHKTAEVLEDILGLEPVGQEESFLRFKTEIGNTIDIKLTPSVRGLMGAGTVHHIAWRARDEEDHQRWRELLVEKGFYPTEILDRNYFKALYFHEGGGILFEIATDAPGFGVDEPANALGKKLMLPSWLESKREELEHKLPQVEARVLEGDKQ
ncbi:MULTISPECIES: ring-cleaving dioxygenase [unclassified Mesobacillus]|uniref:ring-cleaving dioxygenase n=1 Tax=unclassified Mesobacillus TaxID=2675270 RepID=UPI00203D509D|nr:MULTISPECIES: ring-cleaving dioxygenase [unclassified Mesobacillus]MCM3124510.1 ring-cleaving dioxygenase [Mesobacillus sp. MER 33]MCM3234780.1 ring-cleaving dioxygenase [Mesobacillus sp. MER 48]